MRSKVNFYRSLCDFSQSSLYRLDRHESIWISTATFSTPAETHNERDEFSTLGDEWSQNEAPDQDDSDDDNSNDKHGV